MTKPRASTALSSVTALVRRFADARHAMGVRTAPTLAAVNS